MTIYSSTQFSAHKNYPSFGHLFKFFRIKSGFKTISKFADALAEAGFIYDDSLFSHWQRGSRVPGSRKLILVVIEVFLKNSAYLCEDGANLLLLSAGKRKLGLGEVGDLGKVGNSRNPGQKNWREDLEKFLILEKSGKKRQRRNHSKKKHRFNFILSSGEYQYFSKASMESGSSKADFLRKLIWEYRNSLES